MSVAAAAVAITTSALLAMPMATAAPSPAPPAAQKAQKAQKAKPLEMQFLTVSDWHAALDPNGGRGGAAVLSAYFDLERAENPNTLTFTSGDAFGASPPLSGSFDEVPAVEAMNLMGFDVDTLGNHNFDRGIEHLQNMLDIADFSYVSANLENRDEELEGVEDYEIFRFKDVEVAVIGITNPEAPTLVFPGSFGEIVVTDPVQAAMEAREAAAAEGADVFVALTHMGVTAVDPVTGLATGPLIDFADSLEGFDVIFGDHTNVQYQGIHNGAQVVENLSRGATYASTTLSYDRRAREVSSVSSEFVVPLADKVTPDAEIVSLLQPYRDQLGPILGEVVGTSSVDVPRGDACGNTDGRLCESLVGNVVTDAMRLRYGTDFAITNSGGLRDDLTCPTGNDDPTDFCPAPDGGAAEITKGQVLAVLPFGNVAVTGTVSGAELKAMLERSVSSQPDAAGRFAQVSGLCVTYDVSLPAGGRVTGAVYQAEDGKCTGAAIDLTATSSYTVAQNDFMASGGDGYPNVADSVASREILAQVLEDYVAAEGAISPTTQGRIICTTSGSVACPVAAP